MSGQLRIQPFSLAQAPLCQKGIIGDKSLLIIQQIAGKAYLLPNLHFIEGQRKARFGLALAVVAI
jgi:hypothetical protein